MQTSWRDFLRATPKDRHIALFYRDDELLARCVAWWASASLVLKGGAILIGRPDKLSRIRRELARVGVDVDGHVEAGRLVLADAEEVLSRFHGPEGPQREAFRAALDERLARVRVASSSGEVRAWGEMVDLLWERGERSACCRLESLWGEVLDSRDLHLLCSYRVEEGPSADDLADRVRGHSRVLVEIDARGMHREVARLLTDVFGEPTPAMPEALLVARQGVVVGARDPEAILLPLRIP